MVGHDSTMSTIDEPAYNPAQQRVIDLLGRSEQRPSLPDSLATELKAGLEAAVAPYVNLLPDGKSFENRLFLNKGALTNVHGCEKYYLDGQEAFEWNLANSRGTIVHKAIEVSVNLRRPMPPTDLVEEAVVRMADDSSKPISEFLSTLDEYQRAELIGECGALFTRFTECFPPIRKQWWPQVESTVALNLAGNRIRVSGKLDLALGKPPDKVVIDMKTGYRVQSHVDDLRLYALIDFIAVGQPPRKVASYYLDSAEIHAEDITEAVLRSAARRLEEGLIRAIELKLGGAEPVLRPGPNCRWCLHSGECAAGIEFLAARAEAEGW
jgi:PD-(D/E)XK nuclease superfamily